METSASASGWQSSLTQEEYMIKDECILVDGKDTIVGHSNKYNCHKYVPELSLNVHASIPCQCHPPSLSLAYKLLLIYAIS